MTAGDDIGFAAESDIEGILDLQDRNQPHRGGMLPAQFSREWLEAAVTAMPVVVTRRERSRTAGPPSPSSPTPGDRRSGTTVAETAAVAPPAFALEHRPAWPNPSKGHGWAAPAQV
jgi:hypothetical protein